jgi:1,2-dihydroxy-3-keto-5-methylthiopentene dioxygenase
VTRLRLYDEKSGDRPIAETADPDEIAETLKRAGVRFERWEASRSVAAGDDQAAILEAYRADVDRLMREGGYRTADVVSLGPDHPQRAELRQKFLEEHTHSEDEVRFFVAGRGLFSLRIDGHVYEVLCEAGDLLGVPSGTRHWFDMGPRPSFAAIRLFIDPAGWVASFTGDPIANRFPRLE